MNASVVALSMPDESISRVIAGASRLRGWLARSALPLWIDRGTDWQRGGFFEKLDLQATPIEEPRRARVVARQIYVFALAERWGLHPRASEAVDHGERFLLGRLRQSDGRFASTVQPDGRIVKADFDLYEHAFILFSLACLARRIRPDARPADLATRLLEEMRAGWGRGDAGFEESMPPTVPLKSNPHMHLLEAALAWQRVASGAAAEPWIALAGELRALCLAKFIDPATGAVREYFDGHWSPMPGAAGRVVEPGHQFEWAWLLLNVDRNARDDQTLEAGLRLVALAERHGVDPVRQVAVNEIDTAFNAVDTAARLWPQTERVKAWCAVAGAAASASELQAALARLDASVQTLERYLQDAPAGLWREWMETDGSFRVEACKASSLYHVVCAIETLSDFAASFTVSRQSRFVEAQPDTAVNRYQP